MNWPEINNLAGLKNRVWSAAFLLVVTMVSAHPRSSAQAMQQGISVKMASTSSAVPVPDADTEDALIVTVTDGGKLYFGINPVTPDTLAEKLKSRGSGTQSIYVKADARAPYASVVKVLDAAHSVGIARVTLLTAQPKGEQAGTIRSPEGIEMELARPAAITK